MPEGHVPSRFRVSLGAEPEGVARVSAAFADFADSHAFPVAVRRSLIVVLDELLSNTIKYGVAQKDGGWITVDVEADAERVILTLTDNGGPFNPLGSAVPDVTLPVEKRPIGSLGIHLVRQLVDQVSYRRDGDNNVVIVSKRLVEGTTAGDRGGR